MEHCNSYYASTKNIAWPPEVHDYNEKFTKCLQKIKTRHDPTVMAVACVLLLCLTVLLLKLTTGRRALATRRGILEWKHSKKSDRIGLSIQQFLDRFHMSRIGIRFLIGQREYLSSRLPSCAAEARLTHLVILLKDIALNTLDPHPEYVGIICKQAVSLHPPVSRFIAALRDSGRTEHVPFPHLNHRTSTRSAQRPSRTPSLFAETTTPSSRFPMSTLSATRSSPSLSSQGTCPSFTSLPDLPSSRTDACASIFFRAHIVFELLKNSLRAVVESRGGADYDGDYPPIKVVVVEGNEDITFVPSIF